MEDRAIEDGAGTRAGSSPLVDFRSTTHRSDSPTIARHKTNGPKKTIMTDTTRTFRRSATTRTRAAPTCSVALLTRGIHSLTGHLERKRRSVRSSRRGRLAPEWCARRRKLLASYLAEPPQAECDRYKVGAREAESAEIAHRNFAQLLRPRAASRARGFPGVVTLPPSARRFAPVRDIQPVLAKPAGIRLSLSLFGAGPSPGFHVAAFVRSRVPRYSELRLRSTSAMAVAWAFSSVETTQVVIRPTSRPHVGASPHHHRNRQASRAARRWRRHRSLRRNHRHRSPPSPPPRSRKAQDCVPAHRRLPRESGGGRQVPGGYFKREGRPTEKEILTCAHDRSPAAPALSRRAISTTPRSSASLLSADGENDPDILCHQRRERGADASATSRSPVPSARCASAASTASSSPTRLMRSAQLSDLDLVYVGTKDDVIMIEGERE